MTTSSWPLRLKVILVPLLLIVLACGSNLSSTSQQKIVFLTRLPTFTRTPLPQLGVALSATPSPPDSLPDSQMTTSETDFMPPTTVITTDNPDAVVTAAEATPNNSPDNNAAFAPETGVTESPVSVSASTSATDMPLPLDTPPPTATTTQTPLPADTPTTTATFTPIPTDTPTPVPTATPLPEGWVFSGTNISGQHGDDQILYGDVINNTGVSQDLYFISGTFYDPAGQVIPNIYTVDYWPVETIPQGGRIPFELTILDTNSQIANFDLSVDAAPSEQTPAQTFEFLNVQTNLSDDYCVSGQLRNPGPEMEIYLAIVVVLFDSDGNVINFNDHYNHSPNSLVGDQTLDFGVCVDPRGQTVGDYDLRAWGL